MSPGSTRGTEPSGEAPFVAGVRFGLQLLVGPALQGPHVRHAGQLDGEFVAAGVPLVTFTVLPAASVPSTVAVSFAPVAILVP